MKRLVLLTGILIVALIASAQPSRLTISVEKPEGGLIELTSSPVTCSDPPVSITSTFGSAYDCEILCSQSERNDGAYLFRVGVTPQLSCSGPRGELVDIMGTGATLAEPVRFCVDETCVERVDYCDCIDPSISIEQPRTWLSEPRVVRVEASDNHEVERIETTNASTRCTGNCSMNVTVPVGTICTQTGSDTCTVRALAYDRFSNEAIAIAAYDVDLNAPIATHEWLSDGYWQRDEVRIRISAAERTRDESGIGAIYVETRREPGCSLAGANYTRYASSSVELTSQSEPIAYCYYAIDRASPTNAGPIKRTQERRIDTAPPMITIEPNGPLTQSANLTVACSDSGSGCRTLRAGLTNTTCPAPAGLQEIDRFELTCEDGTACTYTVCAWASDGVGYATSLEEEVTIDRSEPVIRVTSLERSGARIELGLLITDVGSGLSTCSFDETDLACEESILETSVERVCDERCTFVIAASDLAGNEVRIVRTVIGDTLI